MTDDLRDSRVGTYVDRQGRVRDVRIERLDARVVAALRRMTPGERIEAGLRHSDLLRESARALIEHQHPGWTREQVRDELFRRMHGADR